MRLSRKNKKQLAGFKRRRFYTRAVRPLIWGTSGVRCLSRIILPKRRLFGMKVWIKWHYKVGLKRIRYYKYSRFRKRSHKYYWMRLRRTVPCTRKSSKSRMGKGKGEIKGWFGCIRAGRFIFEFNWTKFKSAKKLFVYLTKKFTGRVQGVIQGNWRNAAAPRGSGYNAHYFSNRALLTYKRRRYWRNLSFFRRIRLDVQKID